MNISKIASLFSQRPDPARASGTGETPPQPATEQAASRSSDAVTLSSSFAGSGAPGAARQARVEELKQQVQSGQYKQPDGETLAKAFVKEVFSASA